MHAFFSHGYGYLKPFLLWILLCRFCMLQLYVCCILNLLSFFVCFYFYIFVCFIYLLHLFTSFSLLLFIYVFLFLFSWIKSLLTTVLDSTCLCMQEIDCLETWKSLKTIEPGPTLLGNFFNELQRRIQIQ